MTSQINVFIINPPNFEKGYTILACICGLFVCETSTDSLTRGTSVAKPEQDFDSRELSGWVQNGHPSRCMHGGELVRTCVS